MDISSYLDRIQCVNLPHADAETLQAVHIAHMLSVPFENLDIELGRPILLSEEALWDKIVVRRRGGFCYELNGMFAWLLKEIGLEVTYLNGRVFRQDGTRGMDFDHLALMARVPGQPGRWLADVGFGDSFIEPLSFEENSEQVQGLRAYRLEETGDGYIVWQRNYSGTWEREYFFDLTPRRFPEDYEASCHYHQTSPQSSFTRGSIISIATLEGRVTLEEKRLIITRQGARQEKSVTDETQYNAWLKRYFGVVL